MSQKSNRLANSAAQAILSLFLVASACAQPAGKWYAGPILPAIDQTGQMAFYDSLVGYYIGVDGGFVTKDGGVTWDSIAFPSDARPSPSFMFTPAKNTIVSFQHLNQDSNNVPYPNIIKSTDMGVSWKNVPADALPSSIKAFTMWTPKDGFRIWIDDITSNPVCAVSHDAGKTFTDVRGDATLQKYLDKLKQPSSVVINAGWSDSLHGAISVAPKTGASTTPYPVLTTVDGGHTWLESYPTFNGDNTYAHSFIYLYPGTQTIWTIRSVAQKSTFMFYSSDFGKTWLNTPNFTKGQMGTGFTKPAIIQLAPVTATTSWAIVASDSDHPDITRNIIAYNDFSTNTWVASKTIPAGVENGNRFYWNLIDIQFTEKDRGWALAQKYLDTVKFQPAVPVETRQLFLFRTTPPPANAASPTESASSLICYPNPTTSGLVRLQGLAVGEEILETEMTNTLGVRFPVDMRRTLTEVEANVSKFVSGCYFLHIRTSTRSAFLPVIVSR
ncbi:MAG: sialidase family protein [bacterium]